MAYALRFDGSDRLALSDTDNPLHADSESCDVRIYLRNVDGPDKNPIYVLTNDVSAFEDYIRIGSVADLASNSKTRFRIDRHYAEWDYYLPLDDKFHEIRFVRTGAFDFRLYVDGVDMGAPETISGNGQPLINSRPRNQFGGYDSSSSYRSSFDFGWYELRDYEDGPVVNRIDASASQGTGNKLLSSIGGIEYNLIGPGWPADDSQWVYYQSDSEPVITDVVITAGASPITGGIQAVTQAHTANNLQSAAVSQGNSEPVYKVHSLSDTQGQAEHHGSAAGINLSGSYSIILPAGKASVTSETVNVYQFHPAASVESAQVHTGSLQSIHQSLATTARHGQSKSAGSAVMVSVRGLSIVTASAGLIISRGNVLDIALNGLTDVGALPGKGESEGETTDPETVFEMSLANGQQSSQGEPVTTSIFTVTNLSQADGQSSHTGQSERITTLYIPSAIHSQQSSAGVIALLFPDLDSVVVSFSGYQLDFINVSPRYELINTSTTYKIEV